MTLLADVFTAYLGPLLKKHAADEALVWEDLEASRAASMAVMKNSDNAFVSKRLEDLHQTQIQAYREAAVKALREWAQSEAPLQPMEDTDTEESFVERCVNAIVNAWPHWRLDTAKMVVVMEIRKRARATYAKYHPADDADEGGPAVAASSKSNGASNKNDANSNDIGDENNEEGEEDEDGQVEEEGETEEDDGGEDGEAEDESATKPSNAGQKSNTGNDGKKKTPTGKNQKKKMTVRKKGTNAKQSNQQQRKGGPATRNRRSGRGGGKAGAAKSA